MIYKAQPSVSRWWHPLYSLLIQVIFSDFEMLKSHWYRALYFNRDWVYLDKNIFAKEIYSNLWVDIVSGFCHVSLVYFWFCDSPETPVMSCFHGSAWLWVCFVRAYGLWLFCWLCACGCIHVLCEHMDFVGFVSVCYALMSIVLTPPFLLSDNWFSWSTCVFLIALLVCSLFFLLVFAVLCQFVVECTPVGSCLVQPCVAVPCPGLPAYFPPRGSFCFILMLIKSTFIPHIESSPLPFNQPWHLFCYLNVIMWLHQNFPLTDTVYTLDCSSA